MPDTVKIDVNIMAILYCLLYNRSFMYWNRIFKHTSHGFSDNLQSHLLFLFLLLLITEFFWLGLVLFEQPLDQGFGDSIFFGELSLRDVLRLVLENDLTNFACLHLWAMPCLVFIASRRLVHYLHLDVFFKETLWVAFLCGVFNALSWASIWRVENWFGPHWPHLFDLFHYPLSDFCHLVGVSMEWLAVMSPFLNFNVLII